MQRITCDFCKIHTARKQFKVKELDIQLTNVLEFGYEVHLCKMSAG